MNLQPFTERSTPSGAQPTAAEGYIGRVVRGTIALSVVAVINVVGQIAIVPVALRFWGPAKYGEWVALTAFVMFFTLTDLGIQTYVVNRMCAHHARGTLKTLTADLHSALRMQLPLIVLLGCVVAWIGFELPLKDWLGIHSLSQSEVSWTTLILGTEILTAVPMGLIAGTYRASGRLERAGYITAVQRSLLFIIPVGIIAAGGSLPAVALARLAIQTMTWVFVIVDLKRLYPWFQLWPLHGSSGVGLQMLGPGALFLCAALADYLVMQGSLAVIQSKLGGIELAHYSTHRTAVNVGRMISAMLTTAVWPELTAMDARGEHRNLAQAHRSLAKLNGWIVASLLLVFLPISSAFYSAWTLKVLALDLPTLALLIAETTLWGLWSCGSTVLAATNRQGRLVVVLVVNSVLTLVLTFLLVPRLGMRGAALGLLVGELVVAAWAIPLLACRTLGDRLSSYAAEVVGPLVLTILVPLLAGAGLWWILPWRLARFSLVPMAGLILSALLLWRQLNPAERRVAQTIVARIRARLRPGISRQPIVETNN